MRNDLTIVILAAGLGTRMRSRKAKVLHEAGGRMLVEHVVNTACRLAPADRVVVVVGYQADEVSARLAQYGVRFAVQTEQRGTGHALASCQSAVPDQNGLLVVLYGDCPLLGESTLERLIAHQDQRNTAATVITTELDDPTGYGRAIVNTRGELEAIVEHKVANEQERAIRVINSGIYCFQAPLLWKHLEEIVPNPVSNEYYLTDIVEALNHAGHKVSALLHPDAHELLGINTRLELAEVDRIFRKREVERLMRDGVTVRRPETVTVDPGVVAGMDTIVEAGVELLGATVIGEDCRIGTGAIIRDSKLGDRVVVEPYTVVVKSQLDDGASAGPFARFRGGVHLHAGAHVGNFVEMKNTSFGAGSKAGHLAYLGDSEIGSKVNVGAGTITCNYDGAKKHKTVIGGNVFLGSNSTIVAPLEIGEGSYVAAGSVVTEAVPADALAVGRGRQVNKEGWAAKRRQTHKKA